MKIEHLAIWVSDLEKMKVFYETYFKGKAGNLYHNQKKNFTSYFISFESGCRLELMHNPAIENMGFNNGLEYIGIIHFAISLGSNKKVDELTNKIRHDGYRILGEPRRTGDGYYESVIQDPEGNRVELTV